MRIHSKMNSLLNRSKIRRYTVILVAISLFQFVVVLFIFREINKNVSFVYARLQDGFYFTGGVLKVGLEKVQKILATLNVFLIDIDILVRNEKHGALGELSEKVAFGVFDDYLSGLEALPKEELNDCDVKLHYATEKKLLTVVYVICKNLRVQLAVFHRRGEFYWIGKGGDETENTWFNEVDRAMDYFNLTAFNEHIKIASDVGKFLFDYKHSKFIECSREIGNNEPPGVDYERRRREFMFGLKHIKGVFEGFRKNYWLAAGTLLGWYRECSIIQHTTDSDVAMFSYDYESSIKEYFMFNDELRLISTMGLVKDAYELRLVSKSYKTFDLFLMYIHNETHQWNGFQNGRHVFRQWLPLLNETSLCSGELFGIKFIVPCNPEAYLSQQYGEGKWRKSLKDDYFNLKSIVYYRSWSDDEWPYVLRYFNVNSHKIDLNRTLSELNKQQNFTLTHLPAENKNYEN